MPKPVVGGCAGTWNDLDSETNINWLTTSPITDPRLRPKRTRSKGPFLRQHDPASLVVCRVLDLVQQGADLGGSSSSRLVRVAATIRPVSASTPRWSFLQDRRLFVPCFSTHS